MGAIGSILVACLTGLTGACSSASSLVPQGGECFAATDCAAGLVCIPRKDGTRACDSDLSSVEKPATGASTDAGAPAQLLFTLYRLCGGRLAPNRAPTPRMAASISPTTGSSLQPATRSTLPDCSGSVSYPAT